MDKNSLIKDIIVIEWEQFTSAVNMGKRSYCQDQIENFILSRAAYLSIYNVDILLSYLSDIKMAKSDGFELVTQKYAYMMENTDKAYFDTIKERLMPVSLTKKTLVDCIMCMYVYCLEQLESLGKGCSNRPLYSTSDSKQSTSAESYMRGELKSYSEKTLKKILVFYLSSVVEGHNPVLENVEQLKLL